MTRGPWAKEERINRKERRERRDERGSGNRSLGARPSRSQQLHRSLSDSAFFAFSAVQSIRQNSHLRSYQLSALKLCSWNGVQFVSLSDFVPWAGSATPGSSMQPFVAYVAKGCSAE